MPTPVGVGVLIAGGNFDSTDHNWICDNWRYGTIQFWVPAALRDEFDPAKQYDTSHHNHTTDNHMGIAPNGEIAHNGMDHWWDDEARATAGRKHLLPGRAHRQLHRGPAQLRRRRFHLLPRGIREGRGLPSCCFDSPSKPDESGATGASVGQDANGLLAAPPRSPHRLAT